MRYSKLYVSHASALHYWRTNPPQYVLEGADRDIRVLRDCPESDKEIREFYLSEAEFGACPIDVLVPQEAPRPRSILRYHIQKAPLPHNSLFPLRDGIHVASPALCFVQMCKSISFYDALELGMELCGTYALRPEYLEEKASRNYQFIMAASLGRKLNAWKEIHGLAQARKAARYIIDGAASPMETKLYLLLCLPQMYGGYNLPRPELNLEFDLSEEDSFFLRQNKVKPDLLWRKQRLVIEYDGEYHNDPTQATRDAKRKMILEKLDFTVFTVKKQLIYDPLAFDAFALMLARKLGKRIRPFTAKQRIARDALRYSLLQQD